MNVREECGHDRREVLRGSVRWAATLGLSLLSAGLLIRNPGSSAEDRCRRSRRCRGCAKLADCSLPEALSEKNHGQR